MRGSGSRAWPAVIGGSVVCAGAVVAVRPDGWATASYLAGLALLGGGLIRAAHHLRPQERRCWLPLIAGVWCAIAGALFSEATTLPHVPAAAGDVALLCWWALYVPMTVAVIRMIEHRRLPIKVRNAVVKDVAVVTVAATLVAWYTLIQPALSGPMSGGLWATLAAICFPLGDVTMLALALTLLLAPGRRSVPELLIVLAFGGSLVVDILNAVVPAPYGPNSWYTASYLVINAAFTAAALHPGRRVTVEPAGPEEAVSGFPRWRMALLGAALCGAASSAFFGPRDGWNAVPAAAAMSLMIAGILSRLHRAVTDLESAERTMRYQATHDLLTGLANRSRLIDDMRQVIHQSPTLFFVDLDRFKAINDTCGHHIGDLVLKAVAERLTSTVRRFDTVARLGGDEFVVVCTGLLGAEMHTLASRIEERLTAPIDVGDTPVLVGASIGILNLRPVPVSGERAAEDLVDDLLRVADAAMYEAKRAGGGLRIVDYALAV